MTHINVQEFKHQKDFESGNGYFGSRNIYNSNAGKIENKVLFFCEWAFWTLN